MIQIALFGKYYDIVIRKGVEWKVPDKLHLLYTDMKYIDENKKEKHFSKQAKKFGTEIENEFQLKVKLHKVDGFDINNVLTTILEILSDEKKSNSPVEAYVNITDGTKPMAAAATTAVYISKGIMDVDAIYLNDTRFSKNKEIVTILPIPKRPVNDAKGNTSKTTSIVLEKIKKLKKCTHQMLRDEVRKDRRIKNKNQRIEHSLKILSSRDLISVEQGWVAPGATKDPYSGKYKKDTRSVTIQLTKQGEYYANFPDLVGNLE
jgi:hypothetical protein